MNIEAGSQEILNLLLGEGKEFSRMDPVIRQRFASAVELLLLSDGLNNLAIFGRFKLKFFNGLYQINVTAEKRMRFSVKGETILIEFFGSTTHKGE